MLQYPPIVVLIVFIAFAEPVYLCFRQLQGLTTIISEQDGQLQKLASSLRRLLVVGGPLAAEQVLLKKKNYQMIVGEELATSRSSVHD
jgi:hypothetical protein